MSSDLDKTGEGTETVGQKLDTLSASVDKRFDTFSASVDKRFDTLSASVDERFGAVDLALIEQRQYTEFAFDRLDTQSKANELVERRLTALEPRFGQE